MRSMSQHQTPLFSFSHTKKKKKKKNKQQQQQQTNKQTNKKVLKNLSKLCLNLRTYICVKLSE